MVAKIALFDVGAVILDWEPARFYRQILPAHEAEAFCRDICTLSWHHNHDNGVSMADNAQSLIAQYPEKEDLILAWSSGWLEMIHGYVAGVDRIIQDLRDRGVPTFALTNFPAEKWHETAQAYPILQGFEDVIVSGEEKMTKPDPEIYTLTLKRLGNPTPASVFFTDDRQDNIKAALNAGMQGHIFQNASALRMALEDVGLL